MMVGMPAVRRLSGRVANSTLVLGGPRGHRRSARCCSARSRWCRRAMLGCFTLGFTFAGIIVPAQTLMQQETPPALMGRISSTMMSVVFFAQVLGWCCRASSRRRFGVRAVFFLCAVLAWVLTGAGKLLLGTERHAASGICSAMALATADALRGVRVRGGDAGELWRDGRRVRLQRQPSRLLELLVARPGEVVSREEIRQALWGDDTHVDFERSLNFCVAQAAIGAARQRRVAALTSKRVPTRGYRFIAPVERRRRRIRGRGDAVAARRLMPLRQPRQPWWLWVAGLAAVLLALAGAVASGSSVIPAPPRSSSCRSTTKPASADLDRVAKGVSDATVARLATPERLAAAAGDRQRLGSHLQLQAGEHEGDGGVARRAVPPPRPDEEGRPPHADRRPPDPRQRPDPPLGEDLRHRHAGPAQQASIAEEIAKSVAATVPARVVRALDHNALHIQHAVRCWLTSRWRSCWLASRAPRR